MGKKLYYIQLDKENLKGGYKEFIEVMGGREADGDGGYHCISKNNYLGRYQIGEETLIDAGYYDNEEVTYYKKTYLNGKKYSAFEWKGNFKTRKNLTVKSINEFIGIKESCKKDPENKIVNPYQKMYTIDKEEIVDKNSLQKAIELQEDAVRAGHQKKWEYLFGKMTYGLKVPVDEKSMQKYLYDLYKIGEERTHKQIIIDKKGREIIKKFNYRITTSGLIAAAHLKGAGSVKKFLESGTVETDGNGTSTADYMATMEGYDMTDLFNYIPINDREKYVKGAVVNSGTSAKADIKEEKLIKNDKKAKETDKNRSDASYQTFLNPQYENLNDQFSNDKLRTSDDVGPTKKNAEKLNKQDNSEYKTVKKDAKGKIIIRNFNTKDFELYIPNFKIEGIEEKIEEKKEEGKIAQKTEIDFGSFDGNIVCNLARLECSKKSAMGMLKIDSKPVTINGENIAEASDSIAEKNIIMTGSCGNKPCKVVTSGKWQNTIKYFLSKDEVVSTNSTIKCTSGGGTISIKIPWQKGIGHQVFGRNGKTDYSKTDETKKNKKDTKEKEEKPKAKKSEVVVDKSVLKKEIKNAEDKKAIEFIQLPDNGVGYGSYLRDGNDNWGKPEFVNMLQEMAKKWYEKDRKNKISFGDLSKKSGGAISGHASHKSGDDADLSLYYNGVRVEKMALKTYDRKKCQEFVEFLRKEFPLIKEIIFGDIKIRGLSQKSYDSEKLRKQHENHIHIGLKE